MSRKIKHPKPGLGATILSVRPHPLHNGGNRPFWAPSPPTQVPSGNLESPAISDTCGA